MDRSRNLSDCTICYNEPTKKVRENKRMNPGLKNTQGVQRVLKVARRLPLTSRLDLGGGTTNAPLRPSSEVTPSFSLAMQKAAASTLVGPGPERAGP